MDNEATADTSTSALIIMTQIEVPNLNACKEESDQDRDPEPQPIDPGMIKYLQNGIIEVDLSAGYGV